MPKEYPGHGLVLNAPILEEGHPERHYVLGGYSGVPAVKSILMPGGHGWAAYKPQTELQSKNGLETMNCTNYGTHHALCALARLQAFADFPVDCSERYSGVGTGTTKTGNDPHYVIETIRKEIGVIPESFLPFSSDIKTWEQYYAPRPMASEYTEIGKVVLSKFTINHDWVIPPNSFLAVAQKQKKLKDALELGPVCVSVFAWRQNATDGLYFKNHGDQDQHWVWLMDFDEGKSWTIFDQYDPFEKKLNWNYDFDASKIYYITRNTNVTPAPTFGWDVWAVLVERVARGFSRFIGSFKGIWTAS